MLLSPRILPALALSLALQAGSASADKAARYTAEGNRLYAEGKYDEAIHPYNRARIEAPDNRIIDFNIGTTQAQLGKRQAAEETYSLIDPRENRRLYALSRYNTGILKYQEAEDLVAQNKVREALPPLQEALAANRDAIRADRALEDARFNYEVIKRRYEQIQEMLEQQPEEQQQDSPDESQDNEEQQQSSGNPDESDDSQQQDEQNTQQNQDQNQEQDQNPDQEPEKQPGQPEATQDPQEEPANPSDEQDSDAVPPPPQEMEDADKMSPEDARALLLALQEEDPNANKRLMRVHAGPPMQNRW